MTMLEHSQQNDWLQTELESMSSQGASPAKTLALPESKPEWAKVPEADYGRSVPVYLGTFAHDMPYLKTSQHSLVETMGDGLSRFFGTFPRSGMMRNGTVYQLPNLARTTTEIGSGLLPTPRAQEKAEKLLPPSRKNSPDKCTLSQAIHHPFYATPNAGLGKHSYHKDSLSYYVKRIANGRQVDLAHQIAIQEQSGQLNPEFVEWLMGFPTGHTDLRDSETP